MHGIPQTYFHLGPQEIFKIFYLGPGQETSQTATTHRAAMNQSFGQSHIPLMILTNFSNNISSEFFLDPIILKNLTNKHIFEFQTICLVCQLQ